MVRSRRDPLANCSIGSGITVLRREGMQWKPRRESFPKKWSRSAIQRPVLCLLFRIRPPLCNRRLADLRHHELPPIMSEPLRPRRQRYRIPSLVRRPYYGDTALWNVEMPPARQFALARWQYCSLPRWLEVAKKFRHTGWSPTPYAPTLALACFFGACGMWSAAFLYDALTNSGANLIPGFPPWRAHMGIACAGMVAAAVSMFFLKRLEKESKKTAWQSSLLWLPLVAMTSFA